MSVAAATGSSSPLAAPDAVLVTSPVREAPVTTAIGCAPRGPETRRGVRGQWFLFEAR